MKLEALRSYEKQGEVLFIRLRDVEHKQIKIKQNGVYRVFSPSQCIKSANSEGFFTLIQGYFSPARTDSPCLFSEKY